jgi:hypothetical protein
MQHVFKYSARNEAQNFKNKKVKLYLHLIPTLNIKPRIHVGKWR